MTATGAMIVGKALMVGARNDAGLAAAAGLCWGALGPWRSVLVMAQVSRRDVRSGKTQHARECVTLREVSLTQVAAAPCALSRVRQRAKRGEIDGAPAARCARREPKLRVQVEAKTPKVTSHKSPAPPELTDFGLGASCARREA